MIEAAIGRAVLLVSLMGLQPTRPAAEVGWLRAGTVDVWDRIGLHSGYATGAVRSLQHPGLLPTQFQQPPHAANTIYN